MQVYISVDIEGVTGIAHWDEANKGKPDHARVRDRMQAEAEAACLGALDAGAVGILVKDAHASGRNLDPAGLPRPARLIRGWSGHPLGMVQELDASFDALVLIGYHDGAGSRHNPLAHTLTGSAVQMRVNGLPVTETHLHAWTAASLGVPTALVAGDAGLCARVAELEPRIRTVITHTGRGHSVVAAHPQETCERIRAGVAAALADLPPVLELAERFVLEIDYKPPHKAYAKSFYPGAELVDPATVRLETSDWFEVMRALQFIT